MDKEDIKTIKVYLWFIVVELAFIAGVLLAS